MNNDKGIIVTVSDQPPTDVTTAVLMDQQVTTKEHPEGFTLSELLREMLLYYNDVRVIKPSCLLEKDDCVVLVFPDPQEVTTVLGFVENIASTFKGLQTNTRSYEMRQIFNTKKVLVSFDTVMFKPFKLTNLKRFFV